MNKLERRIKDLEESVDALRYKAGRMRHDINCIEREDTSSLLQQTEQVLLRKIVCGVTGHKFRLKHAYVNKEDNYRYGRFTCDNCFLKIARKLTGQEQNAAVTLGML